MNHTQGGGKHFPAEQRHARLSLLAGILARAAE